LPPFGLDSKVILNESQDLADSLNIQVLVSRSRVNAVIFSLVQNGLLDNTLPQTRKKALYLAYYAT
jgi:hypothetical protein